MKQWLNLLGLMERFYSIEKASQVMQVGTFRFLQDFLQNQEKVVATLPLERSPNSQTEFQSQFLQLEVLFFMPMGVNDIVFELDDLLNGLFNCHFTLGYLSSEFCWNRYSAIALIPTDTLNISQLPFAWINLSHFPDLASR